MTGLDLLREIRVNDNEYEAIMMTGFESLDDAKKAMLLGAFSYVAKPLRWEVLKDQVDQALNIVRIKKDRLLHLTALENEVQKRNDELQATVLALESQGRRLDAVINSMEEGLLAIDDQERVMLMNAQAEKLAGVRFGECSGEKLSSAIKDRKMADRLAALFAAKVTTKVAQGLSDNSRESLMEVSVAGRGVCFYHVNIQLLTDKKGACTGKVMTFLDRTDKIKSEQLRTSFLSVVAHELRTPVTIIKNYTAILKGAENKEAIDDMKTASNRLGALVNSLIALARLSDASISANWRSAHIGDLVAEQAEKVKKAADGKKITVEIKNNMVTPAVVTDPQLLGITLAAILDNAVKFSRPGGKVAISLDEQTQKELSRYSISVTDSGKGIDEHVRSRMFENFTQGEDHLTRHYSGLGTGLFLAIRAVELLDGWIDVGPAEGGGSRFTLLMPRHKEIADVITHTDLRSS
jgi:signal transduction histidine kinase